MTSNLEMLANDSFLIPPASSQSYQTRKTLIIYIVTFHNKAQVRPKHTSVCRSFFTRPKNGDSGKERKA